VQIRKIRVHLVVKWYYLCAAKQTQFNPCEFQSLCNGNGSKLPIWYKSLISMNLICCWKLQINSTTNFFYELRSALSPIQLGKKKTFQRAQNLIFDFFFAKKKSKIKFCSLYPPFWGEIFP
jgi:hypothetical protein